MSENRYPDYPPGTPSVTEILTSVGLIDTSWFTPEAAERGTQVHLACRYLAEDRLDWTTLDPRIEPYVRSYEKFLTSTGCKARSVEQSGYCEIRRYCGSWDVVFGYLADLKTGSYEPWHRAQVGGYQLLPGHQRVSRLATIYLQADGSIAKVRFHPAYICEAEFLCALSFYRLKEQYLGLRNGS
jgi:hypothetical protein